MSSEARVAIAEIKVRSIAGSRPYGASAMLNRQLSLGSRLDQIWRLALDVRSVLLDIRLKIRFGKAERYSPDQPEEDQKAEVLGLHARIRKAKVPTPDVPDDDYSPRMRF